MNDSVYKKTTLFHIPLALDLMGKSVNYVVQQCNLFDAIVFNPREVLGIDQNLDIHFELFNTQIHFLCHFEIAGFEVLSSVGINFVNDVSVECIISLGKPTNPERYSSEYEVLKVITRSLEELYHNGRVQEDSQEGRVYTWKHNSNLISFISYPTREPANIGTLLSVQIRNISLHPHGSELELMYDEATKRVVKIKF